MMFKTTSGKAMTCLLFDRQKAEFVQGNHVRSVKQI